MKRAAIILTLAAGLCACHTQRTARRTSATQQHTEQTTDSTATHHSVLSLAMRADSLGLQLTADSIRTPAGSIIYRPRLHARATAPHLNARTIHADSVATHTTTDTHTAATAAEHTAISARALTPATAATLLAAALIFLALLLRFIRKNK